MEWEDRNPPLDRVADTQPVADLPPRLKAAELISSGEAGTFPIVGTHADPNPHLRGRNPRKSPRHLARTGRCSWMRPLSFLLAART